LSYSSEGLVSNKTVVKLLQAGGSVGMASVGADFYGAVSRHSIVFILVVGYFYVEFHFFVHDGCNILQIFWWVLKKMLLLKPLGANSDLIYFSVLLLQCQKECRAERVEW
jgi:hypothetical protein